MPGVSGKAIAEDLLQELCPFSITAHDLIDIGGKTLRVGCWVIHHGTDFSEKVGATVFREFSGIDMQSAVLAIEDVNIRIETAIRDGMIYLCILEDVDPVGVTLPSAGVFHIGLALVLIPYLQSEGVHEVCQFHAVFHGSEIAGVRLPDAPLVVKPHLPFRHITQSVFVEVCEDVTGADVVPRVFGGIHRVKFLQLIHTKVIGSRARDDGFVVVSQAEHCLFDGDIAVSISTTEGIPLLTHQAGLPEQPVHLCLVTAAPECQRSHEGGIRFALALVSVDVPIPQPAELFSVLGGRGFCDDLIITEVAYAGNSHSRSRRCRTAHICVEQPDERFCRFHHIILREGIAGYREESVGVTGDVDLDITFLDVIGLGIVDETVRQQTEDADTRAGGTDLGVG